jgi:lysophospholipase L1-like esterase
MTDCRLRPKSGWPSRRAGPGLALCLTMGCLGQAVLAQQDPSLPAPLDWSREQDHQNMQQQLGITALRPGPSGQENAPNPANYDESIANPFPDWPDLLTLVNGEAVATAEDWWEKRRPELIEAFESEVIGRVPANVPDVVWRVTETATGSVGGRAVEGRQLVGEVDNSAYPLIDVNIELTLVLPAGADGPVPVMILFGSRNVQQAVGNAPLQGFGGRGGARGGGPGAGAAAPGASAPAQAARGAVPVAPQDPPSTEQLIAQGWGFAFLNPNSIQADNGQGLTRGIIGLVNRGQARKPDDWGSLRAWSWGAARALDYFETVPAVDASRVGIEGVSRYGKAALVTLAMEPRFAVGLIGSSGEGGVSPYRRNFGEVVENLTGGGEYHWMAGNFLKYGTAESRFGSMNAGDLPVDSHTLIALAAPRATFISYGVPDLSYGLPGGGDSLWLDQKGSYMAAVAASEVFELLGARGLGTDGDYRAAELPPVNAGLLDGRLAWRQHDGGHTDGPNWKYFIPWANRELGVRPSNFASADLPVAPDRPFPRTDPNSHLAHQELLAKRGAGTIDVFFIGDSITRRWGALDYPEFLAHWNSSFHGWNAANFGWGGDRTENILWRLGNGELKGVDPEVIVVQAGTNNVGGQPGSPDRADAIAAGVEAIVASCREQAPGAVIVLTGIFPRSEPAVDNEIARINRRLERYSREQGLRFIDINEQLGEDGLLRPEMSGDGLHLSLAGYEAWAEALQPLFTEILGSPDETDLAPPPTGNPAARPGG